ncbi:MAG: hypothetical protein WA830_16880 [Candidatus Sulfotelmatobacter sp.]
MPAQLSHFPNLKKVLISLMVMTFSCVCFTYKVEAQTTWLVTVDVTSGSDTPTYQIIPTEGTGDTCDPTQKNKGTSGDIYVCPDDTIYWTAKTKKDGNGNMHHHMIIRQEDDILDKAKGGDPIHVFHAREGKQDGGPIDDTAGYGEHEYSVFIFDKNGPELYVNDPKIIIGGTTLEDELVRLEKNLTPLLAKIANDPKASEIEKRLAAKVQKQLYELKKRTK